MQRDRGKKKPMHMQFLDDTAGYRFDRRVEENF
jgi:hypothetical protein